MSRIFVVSVVDIHHLLRISMLCLKCLLSMSVAIAVVSVYSLFLRCLILSLSCFCLLIICSQGGGAADRAAIQTPSLLVFAPPARPTAKVQEVNNSRGQEVNKVRV